MNRIRDCREAPGVIASGAEAIEHQNMIDLLRRP
jgi:hypothetical protein